ncbi:hypothetical protein [Aquibacillus rhizosphaerae]|uniref:Uncharacterized protein n=1 Tax=Aquibacillus rhizosphaerae TaxID=3051431 RepID=A0ABT7L3B4_9BACI|nr:hypothetical protein [Aquibacillus sp. LR5S19]MDL4839091.1 hypothetical protein [Aquibacillus sp. LR5S19]
MRQVYWALVGVRLEVQRNLEKKERIRMKRSKNYCGNQPISYQRKNEKR